MREGFSRDESNRISYVAQWRGKILMSEVNCHIYYIYKNLWRLFSLSLCNNDVKAGFSRIMGSKLYISIHYKPYSDSL